ncbi:MAG: YbhB/YbcL family Raf kinase inhibitor-like protein [Betaproteobacteria bacterium HGW-Betaproteobacteria-11]|nr:MAG: YbhB/YbcL family Raf kinase inhibitor-like protein [Betaproteobacteria bacterium HGW-Betaproteobacteria-11]
MRHRLVASIVLTAGLIVGTTAGALELGSPDFKPDGMLGQRHVYNGYGCAGENLSPALAWKDVPAGTKSFALLVHDPDAPTGGAGWWHWLVVNIPASVTALLQGAGKADGSALPAGAMQPKTDFGAPGWGGPCPPAGDQPHRYRFTLYALKVDKLDLPPDANPSLVGYMVHGASLGQTTLIGYYGRKK